MKDFFEFFLFNPKRTERIIIFLLKILFTLSYSIWIYKEFIFSDIIEKLTSFEEMKYFLFDGHFILFIFLFLFLYYLFYNFTTIIFSLLGMFSAFTFKFIALVLLNSLDFILSVIVSFQIKKFIYKPFWKIQYDSKAITYSKKSLKLLSVKIGLLKSPEQKIHSSKEAPVGAKLKGWF